MKTDQISLTDGSIWKNLTLFAIPILLGQIFQQLYNTADAWIVGHYCNDAQYAAVTSTGSRVFLLVGFCSGIAVGAGVVIARYFGARDEKNLNTAIHTTVAFGLLAGVLLTVVGVLCTPALLRAMQTDKSYFRYSVEYFRFYFLGSVAIVMYNLGMGILRAVGDSKSPLYYLIFSSLVNVALDFLFVGAFRWGVWSAALATTISQFVSTVLCILRLMRGGEGYKLRLREVRLQPTMLREIIRYGLPSGVQNSIIAFANVIVQSNINVFGPDTVAGCGTYSKLEGFAFLPITCYTMALTTFVSQNLGAGKYDRAKKGSVFGIVSCVVMAEVIGVLMLLLARPLLSFFTKNQAAIAVGERQIQVEALFFCMLSFSHCIADHARRGASDGADVRHARRVVRPARDLYQRRRAARRRELGHLLGLPPDVDGQQHCLPAVLSQERLDPRLRQKRTCARRAHITAKRQVSEKPAVSVIAWRDATQHGCAAASQ